MRDIMPKMHITPHISEDWCHICGNRTSLLADIWYPRNAEAGGEATEYIRICNECASDIYEIAKRYL